MGFSCTCSREQYKTYLKQLDKAEQQDILEHGPFPLELVCVNCNTHYHYEKYELDYLFSDAEGEPK
jgi:molecular chaperone Hsp33